MKFSSWHCPRGSDFAVRIWPDGAVVYDEANGDLHSLTPTAAEVLSLFIQQSTWTPSGLLLELLGELPTASEVEMMENMLMQIQFLSLIEREPV